MGFECATCEDWGYVEIPDEETGGVLGAHNCPDCGGRCDYAFRASLASEGGTDHGQ